MVSKVLFPLKAIPSRLFCLRCAYVSEPTSRCVTDNREGRGGGRERPAWVVTRMRSIFIGVTQQNVRFGRVYLDEFDSCDKIGGRM